MALVTKAIKGTQDLLPGESYKNRYVEQTMLDIASKFGYKEIRTPVFEHTELFSRGRYFADFGIEHIVKAGNAAHHCQSVVELVGSRQTEISAAEQAVGRIDHQQSGVRRGDGGTGAYDTVEIQGFDNHNFFPVFQVEKFALPAAMG